MKRILHSEPRYYVTDESEGESIKRKLHGNGQTLGDLAKHLGIDRNTLYRKLSFSEENRQYYLLEGELMEVMNFTGLEFEGIK